MLPERDQKNVFDDMMNEYYAGQRELIEMPYHVAHAS
jgi:hypothetical protein